jgi:hypothetical protein
MNAVGANQEEEGLQPGTPQKMRLQLLSLGLLF